ncbi:DUF3808 domain-containing protein [bacterium]|nr:DUF3808 domain-containing protein [bacterium]
MAVLLVLILLFAQNIFAQSKLSKEEFQTIERGIDKTYRLKFSEGMACFDSVIKKFPNRPEGYFFKASNYFWQGIVNSKDDSKIEKFKEFSDLAIKKAEKLEKTEPKTALFFLGASYGNLGRYHGMKQNWLRAYWHGKTGLDYLENLVKMDKNYYDAYFGLGIFHYYGDVLPSFVKVLAGLLGLTGSRQQGLEELKLASEKGTFSKTEAKYFLSEILLNFESDYNQAIQIANELVTEFPENQGFLLNLALVKQAKGELEEAILDYTKIELTVNRLLTPTLYSLALLQLSETYTQLDDYSKAIQTTEKLLAFPQTKDTWQEVYATFNLAEFHEISGNRTKAIEFYKQVHKKDDYESVYENAQNRLKKPMSEVEILSERAKKLERAKKYEKVIEICGKELPNKKTKEPNKKFVAETYYRLGKSYLETENYLKAKTCFYEVLTVKEISSSRKGFTFVFLGKAQFLNGDEKSARESFNKALKEETPQWLLKKEIQKIIPDFFAVR